MKIRYILITVLAIFCASSISAQPLTQGSKSILNPTSPAKTNLQLTAQNSDGYFFKVTPGQVEVRTVSTPNGDAFTLGMDQGTPMLKTGTPDLPKLTASIIIPDMANMDVEVTAGAYTDYPNIIIAPSKGNLYRNINPANINYTYGEVYTHDEFFPAERASLRQPFILRDFRGQTLMVNPIQYNPITQVLRIYISLEIHVFVKDQNGVNQFVRTTRPDKIDREFYQIYKNLFLNFESTTRYTPVEENGDMLIISHGAYMPDMAPFVAWKTAKGIKVTMVDFATVGTTEADIQTYVANFYNTNNLKYLLLVGDAPQIPPFSDQYGASDNSYGCIMGSDYYPEVFVGRFSAESNADVQTQVQRSIEYEKNPTVGGTWYKHGVCIGSNLGPGDDNEMDWEHERNIHNSLLGYGYSTVNELYDATHNGDDAPGDPVQADLATIINGGCSVINYTGHGSSSSIVTTGFSSSDVDLLTNTGALPFFWPVGCVVGDFVSQTCFAEHCQRHTYNGQPSGTVASLMSTINQSWNPPMDGQDEMDSILVESYLNNIKRTFGGISMNGCMHMNDNYGSQGDEMTSTWNCFGDPSLDVRTDTPMPMTVSHAATIFLGATQFTVNCNTDGALICLTLQGQILGTGISSGGSATINFAALTVVDTIHVTATAYNKIPYFGTVLIVPSAGAYVIYYSSHINDVAGNNDFWADYAENDLFDVTLKNVGLSDAVGVNLKYSISDPYITITDSTQSYSTIPLSTMATQNSAIAFSVSPSVPDMHMSQFTIHITDTAGGNWSSYLTIPIHAPVLGTGTLTVNDLSGNGNGVLDPSENVTITIPTTNGGHSDSPTATGTLSVAGIGVTIQGSPTFNLGIITHNGSANATFQLNVSPTAVAGTVIMLTYTVTAGSYTTQRIYYQTISQAQETFETNNFTQFPWTLGGDVPWFTTTEAPYAGNYCSKSGGITDSQSSEMSITLNVLQQDSISFYGKVSSEQDYDYFNFFIDAVRVYQISGLHGWERHAFPVTPGVHTFRWEYMKDVYMLQNEDCAWVDNIILPAFGPLGMNNPNQDIQQAMLYPNPAHDFCTVRYSLKNVLPANIQLIDVTGKSVSEILNSPEQSSGTHQINFSTAKLSPGIYFVRIDVGGEIKVLKMVKGE